MVDERLGAINARVAAAADAWLTDPLDAQVYARMVSALMVRRAYLQPPLPEDDPPVPTPEVTQPDEVLDDLDNGTVRPIGDLLGGDPREALDRLRRSSS